jgi:tripeptidyl-peptidase-1
VGATYLDSSSGDEVGATLSSGGFSKNFMRQDWQASAVSQYLGQTDIAMPSEDFYASGRAYPDVSAFGQDVQVVAGGKSEPVSGTSCSAPIFAGVIALINHELLHRGLAPLGNKSVVPLSLSLSLSFPASLVCAPPFPPVCLSTPSIYKNQNEHETNRNQTGFLNPWLYSNPAMFTDVTSGSNPYQKCDGFQASAGWDPVTGLGTPLYAAMLEYALATAQ